MKDFLWKRNFPLSFQLFVLPHVNYLYQENFHSQPWASLTVLRDSHCPMSCSAHGKQRMGRKIHIVLSLQVKTWDKIKDEIPPPVAGEFYYTFISSVFHHNCTAKLCSVIPFQVVQFLYLDRAQILPKKWHMRCFSNHHAMQTTLKFNRSLRSFKAPLPISPLWQSDLSSCLLPISQIPPHQLIAGNCK